eukprot:4591177-Alexandrium_andersonii.AAC.1
MEEPGQVWSEEWLIRVVGSGFSVATELLGHILPVGERALEEEEWPIRALADPGSPSPLWERGFLTPTYVAQYGP